MNNKAALTAIAALVLVAACSSGSETANDANSSAANASGSSAAPAAGSPVTRETLVGTWGQANCTNTMTFDADGTATSTSAEQANNRWSLDGSTIVITSPGEADVRMPATIAGDQLLISGGGGEGQSTSLTRCEPTGEAAGENAAAEEAAE
jgi:hypothetical protein